MPSQKSEVRKMRSGRGETDGDIKVVLRWRTRIIGRVDRGRHKLNLCLCAAAYFTTGRCRKHKKK